MSVVCKGTERTARWVTCFAVAALLGMPSLAIGGEPYFTLKSTVTITGNALSSFDISWVDPELHAYLLSDRSNKAVDVIDTVTQAQSKLAAGAFRGVVPTGSSYPTSCPPNACNGPNGVLTVEREHHRGHDHYQDGHGSAEVWAGDGPTTSCTGRQTPPYTNYTTACSTVKVIDYSTGAITHNIPTGGQYRADELCYDPADHLIQIANDSDSPPYISFIPTEGPNAYTVVKQILFDGNAGDGPNATNGIEQCQWNPRNGMIYLNVPEVAGDGNDDVPGYTVIIDPRKMEIVSQFVIPLDQCAGPQGMAIGPEPEIMLGCNAKGPPEVPTGCDPSTNCTGSGPQNTVVINERNGNVIQTLANQGGNDEVWFNPGDGLYFLAEGSNAVQEQLGIVSSWPPINLLQDIIVASPPGTGHAHSVAADPITNEVFYPIPNNVGGSQNPCPTVADGCVAIYSSQ